MGFMMVGDYDQLLYKFANADPMFIAKRIRELSPDTDFRKLVINYRSTRSIIAASSEVIKNNYGDGEGQYPLEMIKDVQPREDAPEGLLPTFSMYDDVEREAQAVADDIQLKIEQGVSPDEIFVCFRTRAQVAWIETELMKREVPFINIVGGTFWNLSHISYLINYLKLAHDTSNKEAFGKVYRIASIYNEAPWGKDRGRYAPHRYLGKAFLSSVRYDYQNCDPWRVSSKFESGVRDLVDFVTELQGVLENEGHVDALRYIIDYSVEKYLRATDTLDGGSEESKLGELETVIEIASSFDNVDAFLNYVNGMIDAAQKANEKDWTGRVVLSTIHRLKGLERDMVFLLGACEGEDNTGAVGGLLPHTFSLGVVPQWGVLPAFSGGSVMDERCLFFVAITRARLEVHISGVRFYKKLVMRPSRFVTEMGKFVTMDNNI